MSHYRNKRPISDGVATKSIHNFIKDLNFKRIDVEIDSKFPHLVESDSVDGKFLVWKSVDNSNDWELSDFVHNLDTMDRTIDDQMYEPISIDVEILPNVVDYSQITFNDLLDRNKIIGAYRKCAGHGPWNKITSWHWSYTGLVFGGILIYGPCNGYGNKPYIDVFLKKIETFRKRGYTDAQLNGAFELHKIGMINET